MSEESGTEDFGTDPLLATRLKRIVVGEVAALKGEAGRAHVRSQPWSSCRELSRGDAMRWATNRHWKMLYEESPEEAVWKHSLFDSRTAHSQAQASRESNNTVVGANWHCPHFEANGEA